VDAVVLVLVAWDLILQYCTPYELIECDRYQTLILAEGVPSTFSARDRNQHAQKRRLLSQAFSESALRDIEPHILEHVRKWCAYLGDGLTKGEWTEAKDMATWSDYLTFDVLSDLCFGRSLNVLDSEENRFVVALVPSAAKAAHLVSFRYVPFMQLSHLTDTSKLDRLSALEIHPVDSLCITPSAYHGRSNDPRSQSSSAVL
jgi:hypothetical protein